MSELVQVRYILPNDFDDILRIESLNHLFPVGGELIKDKRQLGKKQIMEFMENKSTRVAVATVDNKVQGFFLLDARDANNVILKRLSVEKKRQGVGTIMLNQAIALAKKIRPSRISAFVYEEDDAAIAFFSHHNFKSKLIKKRQWVDNKSYDEIEFSRRIES